MSLVEYGSDNGALQGGNSGLLEEKRRKDLKDLRAAEDLFGLTLELRNFEITQLVQRNNFFMIFQGVLLAGAIQSSHTKPAVSFLVCMAGLIVSLYQIRMAAGAKFWQDYWQEELIEIEKKLLDKIEAAGGREFTHSFFEKEDGKKSDMVKKQLGGGATLVGRMVLRKYSVSQTPIYVAIGLSVIWFLLVLCTMRGYPPFGLPSFIVGFTDLGK
ncbi:RipA family octameric membrane protein [Malikia spinosa]|uniref:RipA family octameric membrane protein n=1 Tax=Malikia spinosa TaxID=86180 RepID=UPI003FA25DE8